MTFLEALQANETEKVECLEFGEVFTRYDVCRLKTAALGIDVAWQKTWRLAPKPQVVEFECEWRIDGSLVYPHSPSIGIVPKLYSMHNGKKWRVRCEEII